jgi:dipeptidyl aminopeptidase/acylaminoacyl peptidase
MVMRPLRADDYFRFRLLGEPAVSPDGRWVAFTVQTCDRQRDENRSAIWIAEGGRPDSARPLTAGTARDRSPVWSPDGSLLAFISDRADGKPQIHVIAAAGGEARRLETDEAVQGGLAWSPDGATIAFVARVFSKPEDWVPYPGAPAGDAARARAQAERGERGRGGEAAEASDVKVVTRLLYRMDGIGEYGDRRTHVFLVPADGSARARRVSEGDYDYAFPAFSPDGRYLAVAANRRDGDEADLVNHTDLWGIELASGRHFLIASLGGPVMAPAWSPDGRLIACIGHDGRAGRKTSLGCWVVPASGGAARCLSAALDRPTTYAGGSDLRTVAAPSVAWSPDGRSVYFPVSSEGNCAIYRADLEGRAEPATPPPGPDGRTVAGFALAARSGTLAYVAGDAVTPDEVYALPAGGSEVRLSAIHAELARELQFQPVRHFGYDGADGWPIDGWFIPAAGVPPTQPAPCVVSIHGGPHGMYGNALQFLLQLYAANGLAVLYVNPRGSEGYGQAFVDAVAGDWGGKDYQDIQAGLDHAVAQGWVDPARCGVTGWSYGGFMTSWTITQTQRFRAAIAGAIVSNRHSFYGTSDIGVHFGETEFPGNAWENAEGHLARSAIRYADRVTTPVLFLHGENDLRCPVAQTEELFTALRRQGKVAVMVRYPGEYHGLQKPRHKWDRMERSLAWFRHWLLG